jgi:hypothetical protein
MRAFALVVLLASLLLSSGLAPLQVEAADCQFVLGFKALHDLIPDQVGDCQASEHHNPENGDGLQETTGPGGKGGLLVWRKSDNWTAFTNGYQTWLNGPNGLQLRLNSDRFPWEGDYGEPDTSQAEAAAPRPANDTKLQSASGGSGRLQIENGRDEDAVIALVSKSSSATVAKVYVRSNSTASLGQIPNGTYFLFYKTGSEWDGADFAEVSASRRFVDELSYNSTATTAVGYRATLQPVSNGNAPTMNADFPG